MVRAEIASLRAREFVQAALSLGASDRRIFFRHLLPNGSSTIIVAVTTLLGQVIVLEATLEFFSVGVPSAVQPTLGNLIGDAQSGSLAYGLGWWTLVVPGGGAPPDPRLRQPARRRPRRGSSPRETRASRCAGKSALRQGVTCMAVRFRRGIWIVGLLAAALGAAAVGVHASSAAPTRATNATSIDRHDVLVSRRSAALRQRLRERHPAAGQDGKTQPGGLVLTTGAKTTTKNGETTETVSQVERPARRRTAEDRQSSCRRVKHQIPLKSKGLGLRQRRRRTSSVTSASNAGPGPRARPSPAQDEGGTPTHALLAVRDRLRRSGRSRSTTGLRARSRRTAPRPAASSSSAST